MTDENKVPDEQLEAIAQSVNPPDEYEKGQGDALREAAASDPDATVLEEAVAEAVDATEKSSDGAVAQGWDSAVKGIEHGFETVDQKPVDHHAAEAAEHGDITEVHVLGRDIVLPVPIYTAVFGVLAVITLVEVLLAEIITNDGVKIPILVVLSLSKAALVVWFYMHLNRDSRLFMLTLMLPLIVGLISALYLLLVPVGYSY
jgi:cytochrome c oxidase subunit IV